MFYICRHAPTSGQIDPKQKGVENIIPQGRVNNNGLFFMSKIEKEGIKLESQIIEVTKETKYIIIRANIIYLRNVPHKMLEAV